jgi:hypothetical protein
MATDLLSVPTAAAAIGDGVPVLSVSEISSVLKRHRSSLP